MTCVVLERRIIGVETFYHPLNMIWHRQDGCETTVMTGEWTAANRSDKQHKRRRVLVHVVRYRSSVAIVDVFYSLRIMADDGTRPSNVTTRDVHAQRRKFMFCNNLFCGINR